MNRKKKEKSIQRITPSSRQSHLHQISFVLSPFQLKHTYKQTIKDGGVRPFFPSILINSSIAHFSLTYRLEPMEPMFQWTWCRFSESASVCLCQFLGL